MSTLMQAVERQREIGALSAGGDLSVRDLVQRFHPEVPGSMGSLFRKMLSRVSVKRPWAVILCRFNGSRPDPIAEQPIETLLREMFTPATGGLVEYWRDVSLGVIDIGGSRVFDWVEIEIPRSKAGGFDWTMPPGPGRSGLIDYAIDALKRREGGNVLNGLLGPIAAYTQNWSTDDPRRPAGTPDFTENDPLRQWWPTWIDGSADGGRVCQTPPYNGNVTAHEMGHVFGMGHDVGSDLTTHYADPGCIMSQNGPFVHPRWNVVFGPALCLPHLVQNGWMYPRRIYYDSGGWMSQPGGISVPLAPISRPRAHANLGIRLTYARDTTSWDYLLEYVTSTEWNQGTVGAPYLFIRRANGQHPAYLGAIAVPQVIGTEAQFIEPAGDVLFRVELTDLPGPIVRVSATKR